MDLYFLQKCRFPPANEESICPIKEIELNLNSCILGLLYVLLDEPNFLYASAFPFPWSDLSEDEPNNSYLGTE